MITWTSYSQDGDVDGVYARMFDASGNPISIEIQANTFTSSEQNNSSVAGLADGGFIVTWDSKNQDSSNDGVYAQQFNSDGSLSGSEYLVNTYSSSNQRDSDVGSYQDAFFKVSDLAVTNIRVGPENGSGTQGIVGQPLQGQFGALTINADGSYSYSANAGVSGIDVFTYTVTDGVNTDTATISITVSSSNSAPTIANTLTNNFTEDSGAAVGDTVATFDAADADDTLTTDSFTLSDTTNYAFSYADGVVTVTLTQAGLDLVNAGTDLPAFTVTASDGNTSANASADPAVTTTNDSPTIANTLTNNFTEDSGAAVGDTVATFDAADADDTLTTDSFTLSDTTNYAFSYADGVVTVTLTSAGLDLVNAGTDLPAFTVTASDGNTSANASADPAVTTTNDSPTIANTLTNNFTEDSGAAVGDTVATFDAADADDTLTTDSFTLSDTTNYAFSYADGVVTVTLTQAGLDLVNAGTDLPAFTVTASDGNTSANASADPAVTTTNDSPTIANTLTNNFTEDSGAAVGDTVATFDAADADDTLTTDSFTLSDTTNYAFSYADGVVTVTLTSAGLDLVNAGTDLPAFTVTASDGNTSANASADPAVTTTNDSPTIANTLTNNFTEDSGAAVGDTVATFDAADADDTLTTDSFTLSDTTNYAFSYADGVVTVTLTQAGLDLVNAGTDLPAFTVTASDGNTSANASADPAVTTTNDSPTIANTLTNNFTEDSGAAVGDTVATFDAADADDTLTTDSFTLSDTTNYAFSYADGVVTVTLTSAGLDLVNAGTDLPAFTVTASDGNTSANASADPAVTTTNDSPTIANTLTNNFTEDSGAAVGDTVATFDAADADDTLTTDSFTLSDTTNYAFSYADGVVTVTLTQAGLDLVNAGTDLPAFTVTASDGNTSANASADPAVTTTNDSPTIANTLTNNFTEDSGAAVGDTVATFDAADADDTLTTDSFTLSDTTNYAFSYADGVVTVTLTSAGLDLVNAGTDLPAFTVTASDGNTSANASADPAVTTTNDSPTIANTLTNNFTEDSGAAVGDTVATFDAADADDTLTTDSFTLSDTTNYAFSYADGVVTVTLTQAGLDLVNAGTDLPAFTVTASDGNTSANASADPAVTTTNDSPTIANTLTNNFTEDSGAAVGDTVATFDAADADDTLTTDSFTLSDTTNYAFSYADGVVTVTLTSAGLDLVNAGTDLPAFTVTASDGNTSANASADPAVTTTNDSPTIANTLTNNFTEDSGAAVGDTVATFDAADADDTLTTDSFTLSDTTNYAFSYADGVVTVTLTQAGLDLVNAGTDLPAFTVTASDGNTSANASADPAVTTTNDSPTIANTLTNNFTEDSGAAVGDTVATFDAADADDTLTTDSFTLSDTTNYAFSYADGVVTVTLTSAGLDLVNAGTDLPAFTVTASDGNTSANASADPAVTTTNDSPTIANTLTNNFTEDSGAAVGDTVATFDAADADDTLTTDSFTLSDTTNYAFSYADGVVTVTLTSAGLDLVNAGTDLPAFTVTASDGNTSANASADPAVTTTNDSPTIANTLTNNFTEDSGAAVGDTVATFDAADADDTLTTDSFTLSDTTNYAFSYADGVVTVTLTQAGLDLVNAGTDLPAFTVTASDGNTSANASADPAVTTTNDSPTIANTLTNNFTEDSGAAVGDTVATFDAADADDTLTTDSFTLSDTTNYAFSYADGVVTVTLTSAGLDLVNAGTDLPAFTVTASDGNTSANASADPAVTTTNDSPTIANTLTNNFTEDSGAAVGDTVATFDAADADDTLTTDSFTLSDTTNYAFSYADGVVTVTLTQAGLDLVNAGTDLPAFTVTASDGNTSANASADPAVTTTNDSPTIANTLTNNFTEDSGAAVGDTVATFDAADADDTLTTDSFTLSDTTNYAFSYADGVVTVTLTSAGLDLVNAGTDLPAFTVTASDGNTSANASADPAVTTTNDSPTIANTLTNNFTEDSGAAVGDTVATFDAADADDTLTTDSFTLSDTTNYAFSYADGVVTVTLTQAGLDLVNAGTDLPTFTVTVSDGKVSTQASANPSINTIDDLPSTRSDSITVFENTTSTVNVLDGVLANDFDEEGALTVRGFSSVASTTYHPNTGQITPMTEQVIGNQLWSSAGSTDAGQSITTQFGTMTINSDGSFNYAVNEEYIEQLSAECIVYDEFIYEAMDSNGNITTESIIVEIRGVNDAVIVTHDTMETTENSKAIGNVLNNDLEIDIDGKMISMKVTGVSFGEIDKDNMPTDNVSVEVKGQYGTLLIEENGDYTYTPFPEIANQLLEGDQITEVFNYVVSDAYSSSQGEITITINGMGINTTPETSSTVNTLTETVETETVESNSITESVEEAPAQESTAENETTAEEIAEEETAEEELISEDEVESEDSESIDEESVTIDDDGNVIVDTGTIQVAEVAVQDDGSISVSVVDDNATEVQEYALADDGSIPDWVSINSVTGEITVNPPPGETEVTFTIQAIDANGAIRTITMSLDLVNGTATTLNLSEALDSSSEGNIQLIANDSDTSIDNASNVTETFDVDSGDILSSNSAGTTSIELSNIQSTDQGYVIDIVDQNAANVASYSITSPNGGPIPSWVSFNAETGQIVANPPDGVDTIEFVVTANDFDGSSREITATIDFDSSTNPNLELNEEDGGFGMNNSTTTPFSDQLNQEIFEDEKQNIA